MAFFHRRGFSFDLEGAVGLVRFLCASLLLKLEFFFVVDFPLELPDSVLVLAVPSCFTFTTSETSWVPALLGSPELSVDDDLVAVDLPAVASSDRVVCSSLVSELDECVAVGLFGLFVLDDADVLDLAKDVELLVESVLGGLVVESADKDGLVGVALDLLVRMRVPYTKVALLSTKHKLLTLTRRREQAVNCLALTQIRR